MKNKLIDWIKEQVRFSGAKGIVVGLSGGIDSSVVAGLCREAVGKDNLLALIMPSHSQKEDSDDALLLAKTLDINTKTIDLSNPYDNLKNVLPEANNLANVNLKPRLRMLVLYYFANKLNYLVCGTGNKSELMVGYFTKYGDGGVDMLPIGNLYKRDVRVLAKELGVPDKIITKPPTAGLWPGQTDEGEMGITYDELDDILDRMENNKPQNALKDKVEKVRKMVERSEHKRLGASIYKGNN